jgi:succinate dehydrogenase / fumarate reductase iron-sulfur subunit
MVEQMDKEAFGGCTNHGECQEACPKGISIKYISRMNRDYLKSQMLSMTSLKGEVKAQ